MKTCTCPIKKILILIFTLIFQTLIIQNISAAEGESMQQLLPKPPLRAIISPHGARLETVESLPVQETDGMKYLEFIIPQSAENLEIKIPGQTIGRWTSTPAMLEGLSQPTGLRNQLALQKDNLNASLEAIQGRISVWLAQTAPASPLDLAKRQELMEQELPGLLRRQEELKRRLTILNRELAAIPETNPIGQKITVSLSGDARSHGKTDVHYAYNLDNCGWQPVYIFNANIEKNAPPTVETSLFADIWQYTGLDWRETELVLSTRGSGSREPAPLPKWIVGNEETPAQPRAYNLKAARPLAAGMTATMEDNASVEAFAPVTVNGDSLYARWRISFKGLPEGRSRIFMQNAVWNSELSWLARPSRNNNQSWLVAKCEVPSTQVWPAGMADFLLNGQNIGKGEFTPKGPDTELYFGADPRVHVATTTDAARRGEKGFINTSSTWTGAWTYTITNDHNQEILIKVERPIPMITNEKIKVSYMDTPPGQINEKEHLIYWSIKVPAHGKETIQHSLTITSPDKLPVFPVME